MAAWASILIKTFVASLSAISEWTAILLYRKQVKWHIIWNAFLSMKGSENGCSLSFSLPAWSFSSLIPPHYFYLKACKSSIMCKVG